MKKNKIPKFRTEDEAREFWSSHDSTKYVDWKKAKEVTLSNLKPSMRSISIRFPEIMIEELKLLAHFRKSQRGPPKDIIWNNHNKRGFLHTPVV